MLAHTLKTAVRVLLRRKFFTAVSLFGVALTLVVIVVVAALLDHTIGAYPPETRWPRSLGVFRVSLKGEGWTRSAGSRPGPRRPCARGPLPRGRRAPP